MTNVRELIPYEQVEPGFEAIYTGERRDSPDESTDQHGRVIERWSLWPFGGEDPARDAEIEMLNQMQAQLGLLDAPTRQIRAQIASLTPCDSGVPATVDELLDGINRGQLQEPTFRNGCWYPGQWWEIKSSQPRQLECLRAAHEIVTGRLAGLPAEDLVQKHPHAREFVARTYQWLGLEEGLTPLQKLLVERMLLPFQFFTQACHADPRTCWPEGAEATCEAAMAACYEEGGRGREIDAEIEVLAGLPEIRMAYPRTARQAPIDDPEKQDLYVLCCSLAHGLHTLCDCHHSAFRWIENWIYSIGTGRWTIPTRREGTERERLGRLLFGYLLGMDKWLLGVPMQFLLLDLGHVDLGFDPKSEVTRVYAYLGEARTPLKQWLVGALWHNLSYNTGGLAWRDQHGPLIERMADLGLSVREWVDARPNS